MKEHGWGRIINILSAHGLVDVSRLDGTISRALVVCRWVWSCRTWKRWARVILSAAKPVMPGKASE